MSDHRDVFSSLISAVVEKRISANAKRGVSLQVLKRVLNRQVISEFLWDAYRDLDCGEKLAWGNFEVEKFPEHLRIEIKSVERESSHDKVFLLATDSKGLEETPEVIKIVGGGRERPLLFAQVCLRDSD